jgi:hypothetical protein
MRGRLEQSSAHPILHSGETMIDHKGLSCDNAAAEVLQAHVAQDGWCRGCRDQWNRLVPYPCTQVEWAQHVNEASKERS